MKWKIQSLAFENDKRVIEKFALFPVVVYDGSQRYRIWLEKYKETQIYKKVAIDFGGHTGFKLKWITMSRRPIFLEHGA